MHVPHALHVVELPHEVDWAPIFIMGVGLAFILMLVLSFVLL
jgi:hypothetical protein